MPAGASTPEPAVDLFAALRPAEPLPAVPPPPAGASLWAVPAAFPPPTAAPAPDGAFASDGWFAAPPVRPARPAPPDHTARPGPHDRPGQVPGPGRDASPWAGPPPPVDAAGIGPGRPAAVRDGAATDGRDGENPLDVDR